MSQKFNYYGMVGSNGYGIVESWKHCSSCSKYFKCFRQKGFYTSEDAYDWITEIFSSNYVDSRYEFVPLEKLLKDKLVFIRKQSKENELK